MDQAILSQKDLRISTSHSDNQQHVDISIYYENTGARDAKSVVARYAYMIETQPSSFEKKSTYRMAQDVKIGEPVEIHFPVIHIPKGSDADSLLLYIGLLYESNGLHVDERWMKYVLGENRVDFDQMHHRDQLEPLVREAYKDDLD